jgi:glycosyltransferase involved in cell wall biosynthesis
MSARRDPLPVSVVIPAYDAAATIAATLDSLVAQTRPAAEVVVVDDGSRDATAEVVAAHPIGARLLRQPNGGLARARNVGVRAATQSWIVLLDADDLCDPRRLEAQWAVFGALPDTGLCASDFSMFDRDGPVPGARAEQYYTALGRQPGGRATMFPEVRRIDLDGAADAGITVRRGRVYPRIALGNMLHPPTLMFPRSLIERAGPFPEHVGSMSDFVWIVAAAMLAPVAFIDEPLLA